MARDLYQEAARKRWLPVPGSTGFRDIVLTDLPWGNGAGAATLDLYPC